MQIIVPLNKLDDHYEEILNMTKDEMVQALRNYNAKQVIPTGFKHKSLCPNCRNEIRGLDRFCSNCGKALRHFPR